jgi:hypothetical protein
MVNFMVYLWSHLVKVTAPTNDEHMAQLVTTGAILKCSFGAAPATLNVLPTNKTLAGAPAANIMDHQPMVNIPSFGMCSSLANPTVAAATTAASGVLTPMPCVPATVSPWAPGSPTAIIGHLPALNSTSKCICNWGGVIEIAYAGQGTTLVS